MISKQKYIHTIYIYEKTRETVINYIDKADEWEANGGESI